MAKDTMTTSNTKQGESEEEIIVGPPVPPDGGWGWVVMIASFILSVLVDGVCLNIGIFFPYFLTEFQSSKGKTSMAGSVLNGTYLLVGPITSALTNKFGCRRVTIAGSLLAALAFFLSTFAPNVDTLILLYGAMGGFGFGLMYLPAIVMVGYYFEAKRALATGVAVCGSGIGLFLFAPITQELVTEYSWKGALWIISAVVLHGLVCGAAYRPLPPTIIKHCPQKELPVESNGQNAQKSNVQISNQVVVPDIVVSPAKSDELIIEQIRLPFTKASKKVFHGRIVSEDFLAAPTGSKSKNSDLGRLAKSQDISAMKDTTLVRQRVKQAERLFQPLQRKDIFYSGSIHHLPDFQSSESISDYETKVAGAPVDLTSQSDMDKVDTKQRKFQVPQIVKDLMDFSLISSPTFLIYLISCFLVMFGFFVPFAYIPSLALELGIDSIHGAFLVSVLGITNTIGRILSGALSDRSWVDCVLVNNVTLIAGGVICLTVPFYTNYAHLATFSAVYGLCISPFVSLRSVIIVELLGLDKLTNAFGLVIFSQGLSSYLGSPIAGALADSTGNYNAAFYMAGVSLLASGIMGLPLRRISKWEKKRKSANQHLAKAPEEVSQLMQP